MSHDTRPSDGMRRVVSAHLEAEVTDEADLALALAVAGSYECESESLRVVLDRTPIEPEPIEVAHGGRLHLLRGVAAGSLVIDYEATVSGMAEPLPVTDHDWVRYLRPSRYCESDRLGPLARREFAGLDRREMLAGVSSWVGRNLDYVAGSSRPIDGAVETLLAREGVCRDFAHLTAALLRANGVPARVTSVYAPGLDPMDFHAVTEALIDGQWDLVDPTLLAPRGAMVRIATGADASDTAFMTTLRGIVDLRDMEVTALADPSLPDDDVTATVQLR